MGTPEAAAKSLARILSDGHDVVAVYTQPDRPAGRGKRLTSSPVKLLAVERGLPIFQPVKLRNEAAADTFRSHNADVAVVVAYGRILPEAFLEAFPGGAVNVHFSLLPKYRGAAPVNWAIVNGETETGVTIMKMDSGLDTGDILLQRSTHISTGETAVELMGRLAKIGAELLSEALVDLDKLLPRSQPDEDATYAPIMTKDNGQIEWGMSAVDIVNRVRGFQPFPTSFTFVNGKRLTIWNAEASKSITSDGDPGTVIEAHGDKLMVSCGAGTQLLISEVQPEGKQRMKTRDFLNGSKITAGMLLGGINKEVGAA
jgi:methionyl-tRNA formyltransferase